MAKSTPLQPRSPLAGEGADMEVLRLRHQLRNRRMAVLDASSAARPIR